MTKELHVPLDELRRLTVRCPGCHTETTFDLSTTVTVLEKCPFCEQEWPDGGVVKIFEDLYGTYRQSTMEFAFRVAADYSSVSVARR